MSSDDDDEEELLQRALAQQVERDQIYKRPPPQYSSPTEPALGSGPPRRVPPRTPPKRAPPAPPPMDDEEESDVELLSISSDDEDAPPANRRAPVQKEASKWPSVDEANDDQWDRADEEPENWTRVDEAELTRKVREMRETRAVRIVQPTTRMNQSTVISAPRGEDLLDPFGLGFINLKTLNLERDNRDGFEKAGKHEDEHQPPQHESAFVRDPASREKVMYHSGNFEPRVFLARVHQNTSASELEAGEAALKRDFQNCKDELKKLVKENFDCFISCKNTIDDIHSKLQRIEADAEGAGTIHLSTAIQSVDVVAKRAFGPLLERQAQAERIRSVQGMLQRFRTLFNLPSIIRGHISMGKYDLAIREYKKAKSLVQYTHVGILSRVLEEVEKIVQEFKDMLYKTMENPKVDTSQLENTIRLLLELEPDSDPVWHYLSIQDRRIRGLLEGCSLEHEARMDSLHGRVREKAQSDARWKQLQHESKKASDVDFNLLLGDQDKDVREGNLKESTGEESDALLGRLIRRLTVVLIQHVPYFWRLALLIFSGKFVKVSQPGSANGGSSFGSNNEVPVNSIEDNPASTYSRHSVDEVVIMVHCIISVYETKVRNAFMALADANVHRPHMREALMEITKACVALQAKGCAPSSAVQALLVLRTEVTRVFVLRLCTLLRGATTELMYLEDWVPVPTTERGGTPYAISYLPLRFHNMLVATMDHMTEMIQKLVGEPMKLLEDLALQVHQMQDNVRITFVECFLDLAECLDRLASDISQSTSLEEAGESRNGETETSKEDFTSLIAGSEVTSHYQRLLMILSNAAYCKNSLLPALSQKYQSVWSYASSQPTAVEENHVSTTEEAFQALSTLEDKILNQYNLSKAAEVGVAAAAYLLDDGTQWGQTPTVKGIRDNVVELMHPLVTAHAEVYSGAKPYLDKVINALVEGLLVALFNVFTDNKHKILRILDINGYAQLTLELDFISAVLERYFTTAAREAAMGLRDMLLEKVCESVREMHQADNTSHSRRSRGSEDAVMLESTTPMSPDEIQAYAHQLSVDFLPVELRRARTNVICFTDFPSEYNPGVGRRVVQKTSLGRHPFAASGPLMNHLRRSSGSLGADSDSGRTGLPPLSPAAGYASSDVGSETSSKGGPTSDRYSRLQVDSRIQAESMRTSRRTVSLQIYDTDL